MPTSPFDDGDLYDVIFHQLDYAIAFYVKLAREAAGPVLDIGCGTGRILLPCLQAGAEVDGLDLAAPMLDRLKQKAANLGVEAKVYEGDMAKFTLPRRYALIMITFNAFVHNLTQEDQIRCLECCRAHLLPGGKLVFDGFFPGLAIIGAAENTRVLEMECPHPTTGNLLRLYDTRRFDRVKQLQHSVNEIEEVQPDGSIRVLQRSEFAVRWVYLEEMKLLLRQAGFTHWKIDGNFDGQPLVSESDGMVVTAWD